MGNTHPNNYVNLLMNWVHAFYMLKHIILCYTYGNALGNKGWLINPTGVWFHPPESLWKICPPLKFLWNISDSQNFWAKPLTPINSLIFSGVKKLIRTSNVPNCKDGPTSFIVHLQCHGSVLMSRALRNWYFTILRIHFMIGGHISIGYLTYSSRIYWHTSLYNISYTSFGYVEIYL